MYACARINFTRTKGALRRRTNTPSGSIVTFLLSVFLRQIFPGNLGGFGVVGVRQPALALASVIERKRPSASPQELHSLLFPPQRHRPPKLREGMRSSLTTSQMPPGAPWNSYPCDNRARKHLRCSPILVTTDDLGRGGLLYFTHC